MFLPFKARVYLKTVFPPCNLGLTQISRSRFKKCQKCSHIMSLCLAVFCEFWGPLGFNWEERVFLKV